MNQYQPSNRTLIAWRACGFTPEEIARRCRLSAEIIRPAQCAHADDWPLLPFPEVHRLRAGLLQAIVVVGKPWVPASDVPELRPWLSPWENSRGGIWQIIGLEARKPAPSRDFAELFLAIFQFASLVVPAPLLLVGVHPKRRRFFQRRMGFDPLTEIPCWGFAGGLPTAFMVRTWDLTSGGQEQVRRWMRRL